MAPGRGSARLTSRDALAAALLDQQPLPAEVMEQVLAGVRAWVLGAPLPLQTCMGLPSTPARARQAIRDHYLRLAGAQVDGATPWHRARALQTEVVRFDGRVWPCWRLSDSPPCYATDLDVALWHARRWAGEPLPQTAQALRAVLAKHIAETP